MRENEGKKYQFFALKIGFLSFFFLKSHFYGVVSYVKKKFNSAPFFSFFQISAPNGLRGTDFKFLILNFYFDSIFDLLTINNPNIMKLSPIILVTPNDSLKNRYPSIIDNAITIG